MTAGDSPRLVICSAVGEAGGAPAAAAALGVAATRALDSSEGSRGVMVIDFRASARPARGSVLASTEARSLEEICGQRRDLRAAARGRLCFAIPSGRPTRSERVAMLADLLAPELGAGVVVAVCDPADFRSLTDRSVSPRRSALLKGSRGRDRPLIAMLAAELRREGVPMKVWVPPLGPVAVRRALAGLDAGGDSGRRAERLLSALLGIGASRRDPIPARLRAERAQALPAVLGIAILVVSLALILLALGGAATAKGRLQRAADLAAISAARSMRDDFGRLFVPPVLPNGAPNPAHLDRAEYLDRARAAASEGAARNDLDPDLIDVSFPDGLSIAPLRVRVAVDAELHVGDDRRSDGPPPRTSADAEAEVSIGSGALEGGPPTTAEGGGYAGPLAYRQGEPMRPDVAVAFDRMAAAARSAGVALVINSAYRSDAEQQRLWDANPDPRWVAPPGTSLHRCGTELDLGSPAAYGWLAASAGRFGFVQRYSWEPWHYGFEDGPAPCSTAGDRATSAPRGSGSRGDGTGSGGGGLPSFVPARFRRPLLEAASRYDVSGALLAAQLMAESNFNPNAVSSAGAQGIAQFMPATAASYDLRDPFDPIASIAAQARMMSGLLRQFGSVQLALAAYNAGPGAVAACNCVPPYPETQAYVARILALLGGAGGAGLAPPLEVRLVA
jgi:Transglycosylase SLT domain/D-alanyl-D-alanine carboxypeptidase